MQVWAGTGEPNSRNTISPGGGVYKSTDGGITWKLMGLEKTQAIGRIVVHPTNPNIVYVAALGAPWNANPERGLYKTEDGGQTWQLIKFISDKAGFVDVALDPSNPNTVWASSWQRVRGPYFLNSGGPGSALWKSTDAGKTWTEIKGGGFPETTKGRIGIAISLSNPQVMYTLVEADTLPNREAGQGASPRRSRRSGLYRSDDGGATWTRTNDQDTRPFYYSQVRVHPKNPDRVYWSSTPVLVSNDGGKTSMQRDERHSRRPSRDVDRSDRPRPHDRRRRRRRGDHVRSGRHLHVREHVRRSGSSTTSATTSRSRTACAAACRTTDRGAGRAGVARARSPTRCGSPSAAATDS